MYDVSIWLRNRYDVHEFSESVTGSEPGAIRKRFSRDHITRKNDFGSCLKWSEVDIEIDLA